MKLATVCTRIASAIALLLAITVSALAQSYPAPKEGTWIARDFKFHTGEVMPELKLAYTHGRRAERRAGAGAARHDAAPARAC